MATAPSNGGFTVSGPGFIRLWLADDSTSGPGTDVYARSGERYPLKVASYEYVQGSPQPAGLSWLPDDLGGYRKSVAIDGVETADVSGSVGFYVIGDGDMTVDGNTCTVASGDFFAGNPQSVTLGDIGYLAVIYAS